MVRKNAWQPAGTCKVCHNSCNFIFDFDKLEDYLLLCQFSYWWDQVVKFLIAITLAGELQVLRQFSNS